MGAGAAPKKATGLTGGSRYVGTRALATCDWTNCARTAMDPNTNTAHTVVA